MDDGLDGSVARTRLREDGSLHAPHLVDVEVLSVLRRRVAAGHLTARRARVAIGDLTDLPMVRYPHVPFTERIWELRSNLTPYDGSYVALAEALECPLVTGDARLARTPRLRCMVEVLSV